MTQIISLGNRHAGKSTTWNTLFQGTVRTGTKQRDLHFNACEYVRTFVVSGSPEERGKYVGDLIANDTANIVLCSLQ